MHLIDIIISKFLRLNYTKQRAEEYAAYLVDYCNIYNLNPLEVAENFDNNLPLYSQLNDYIMNNRIHGTYTTGTVTNVFPNKFVARAIL